MTADPGRGSITPETREFLKHTVETMNAVARRSVTRLEAMFYLQAIGWPFESAWRLVIGSRR